jgi:hypothetical protein
VIPGTLPEIVARASTVSWLVAAAASGVSARRIAIRKGTSGIVSSPSAVFNGSFRERAREMAGIALRVLAAIEAAPGRYLTERRTTRRREVRR